MADYRPIKTDVWRDGWFSTLTPEERLVWIFLLTNEHVHISGIYELPRGLVAPYSGVDNALDILKRFEERGKIEMKEGWIFIVNYLKNQTKQINKKDNIVKSILTYFSENPGLISLFSLHSREPYKELLRGFQGAPKGLSRYLPKEESRKVGKGKEESNKESGASEASLDWVRNIPETDKQTLMTKYRISPSTIHACAEDLIDYCEAKGKLYKDYRAALRNFIKSHITRHPEAVLRAPQVTETQKTIEDAEKPRTPEEQARIDAKLHEMRASLGQKMSIEK